MHIIKHKSAMIYYTKGLAKLRKYTAESIKRGLEKFNFDVYISDSIKAFFNPDVKNNYGLCICIGWSSSLSNVAKSYECPKIFVFDPQLKPSVYNRGYDDYFGVQWNGPHLGYYYRSNLSDDRWKMISKRYDLRVKPWKKKGKNIVIAHLPHVDYNRKSREEFYNIAVSTSVKTGRKVIVCLRPPNPRQRRRTLSNNIRNKWKELGCVFKYGIKGNLDNAYCLITSGGTTQTKGILYGIPSYSKESNITNPLKIERNLDKFLNKPSIVPRLKWLNWVAYQQWTIDEMNMGLPFKYLFNEKNCRIL